MDSWRLNPELGQINRLARAILLGFPFNSLPRIPASNLPARMTVIEVGYDGPIAVIVLNKPNKLNALTKDEFYQLARTLQEVADHDEVVATVLTGNGRFFSA